MFANDSALPRDNEEWLNTPLTLGKSYNLVSGTNTPSGTTVEGPQPQNKTLLPQVSTLQSQTWNPQPPVSPAQLSELQLSTTSSLTMSLPGQSLGDLASPSMPVGWKHFFWLPQAVGPLGKRAPSEGSSESLGTVAPWKDSASHVGRAIGDTVTESAHVRSTSEMSQPRPTLERRDNTTTRPGCNNCARRHIPCRGTLPACDPCLTAGLTCSYPAPQVDRGFANINIGQHSDSAYNPPGVASHGFLGSQTLTSESIFDIDNEDWYTAPTASGNSQTASLERDDALGEDEAPEGAPIPPEIQNKKGFHCTECGTIFTSK